MLLRSKKTEDVCKEFLEKLKSERKKLSTRANYQQKIYKYILPNLPFLAKKIRKSDCDCLINSLKETLSYKSINDIIILMNSIFIFSFEKKYMKKLIKLAKTEEHPVDNIEVFTKEEQEKLQEYLLSHLDYFNFSVLLALGSGIRIGELSALTNDNFFDDFIAVKYTLQRVKNIDSNGKSPQTIIVISEAKSKKSIREVPFNDIIINTKKTLVYNKSSYILTGSSDFIEPRSIERRFKKILVDCKIKYRKFHTLRHTFAMNCVKGGMSIELLSELLGHSSIKTTRKYYIHYDLEIKKEELKKVHLHLKTQMS